MKRAGQSIGPDTVPTHANNTTHPPTHPPQPSPPWCCSAARRSQWSRRPTSALRSTRRCSSSAPRGSRGACVSAAGVAVVVILIIKRGIACGFLVARSLVLYTRAHRCDATRQGGVAKVRRLPRAARGGQGRVLGGEQRGHLQDRQLPPAVRLCFVCPVLSCPVLCLPWPVRSERATDWLIQPTDPSNHPNSPHLLVHDQPATRRPSPAPPHAPTPAARQPSRRA